MTHPELPANIEAEKATLGSILLNREAIVAVAAWLVPEFFYLQRHAQIYEAMLACYNQRIPPDTRTVAEELRRRGRLDMVGGLLYMTELVEGVPTSYHIEYYARVVERTALLRQLIQAGGKIAALGYDEKDDLEETLDKAEQTLFEVSQRRSTSDFVHIGQVIDQYYEQINYLQEHRGEVVGVPTGFRDLDQITGGLQRSDLIILAARPGVGKCMTAHTLIDDPATGARLTIEACVQQRLASVYGVGHDGRVRPALVSAWVDSGVQPCYRVRTRTGRMVEVTGHHPFLTVNGWAPLHDLKVGDTIAVPRQLPVFGSDQSWPLEHVRLLAYFIAEGGLTGSSPAFTNTDPAMIEDFRSIIAQHFPQCRLRQERITYTVAQPRSEWTGRGAVMPPNPVTQWLHSLGVMGKLAREKSFPDCVWRWSRAHLAEFIRVLMSCDGSIYQSNGRLRIEFTVAAQQLAADMHHAFVRFGLIAKFYQTAQGAWRVIMTDPESIARYQREIGWIGEKSARFADIEWPISKRGSNIGHPPLATWEIVTESAQRRGIALAALARQSGETSAAGRYGGYNAHRNHSLPRGRLAGYADALGDHNLRRIASPDLYWDPIETIETIGAHQVYDLSVPDGANFIAQDIVVHNTSFAMSMAYNVATLNHGTVAIFSLEMGREQLVQRLLAMDTKIDSHRLRMGNLPEHELRIVMEAMGRLAALPIYIEDTAGVTIMDVRSKARRLQSQSGVDLIVIDYLQLMQGRRSDNRVQEVSEISRGLKALARELNVPVLALSQLSRAVEGRTSHVPMLSDLRESGCVTGDTQVYLPDTGQYVRIDSLVGQAGFNVLALNTETWGYERRAVTNAFATGRKPVFRITTRLGRTIRATANHKFLTIQGWQRLDALMLGGRLAMPRRLAGPAEATMGQPELALLGHLIGDGCTLARQPIHYTTNDMTLAETVAELATEIFGERVAPRIQRERDWYQVYLAAGYQLTHGVRNPVAIWMDAMGVFDLRSHEKFVPDCVFRQPASHIALFLRHLWSTDGCIKYHGDKHYPTIYYASSSERLIRNVQSLLLRLGINGTLSHHGQGAKGRDQHHVTVSGKDEMLLFLSVVKALGQDKVIHLKEMAAFLQRTKAKTSRDILLAEHWASVLDRTINNREMTKASALALMGYSAGSQAIFKQNMSRDRALRFAEVLGSDELRRLATSDVYWDEVVSIEPDGEEEVYDLTVEGLHNFVANDITLHNSIEQDADIVMFIYREELYDQNTDKKGIAEVHISKHRNGPVGVVPMRFEAATTRFEDLSYRTPDGY